MTGLCRGDRSGARCQRRWRRACSTRSGAPCWRRCWRCWPAAAEGAEAGGGAARPAVQRWVGGLLGERRGACSALLARLLELIQARPRSGPPQGRQRAPMRRCALTCHSALAMGPLVSRGTFACSAASACEGAPRLWEIHQGERQGSAVSACHGESIAGKFWESSSAPSACHRPSLALWLL